MSEENTTHQDTFASPPEPTPAPQPAPANYQPTPEPAQIYYQPMPEPAPAYYQTVPPQYDYQQPAYAQPVAYPQEPQTSLSGGPKTAWFFLGFLLGIPAILLAYATNIDKFPKVRGDAVKFSAIGFGVAFLLSLLLVFGYFALIIAIIGSAGDFGSFYYNTY